MVRLHPYQYTYYNVFIGGMPGAAGKYELDYWATSYREIARELTRYANADAEARGIPPDKRSFRVKICGPIGPVVQFLPVMFGPARDLNQADFYISFTRWSCDKRVQAAVAVEVKRLNTRLAVAMDLQRGFTIDPSVRESKLNDGTLTSRVLTRSAAPGRRRYFEHTTLGIQNALTIAK